ncbi:MAG: LLM class flavin-dependent oxidoreductase [Chloroflexota bacterium]
MEIGIDSFAANVKNNDEASALDSQLALAELLERITYADEVGLDTFGIGEHYRKEFLDSAPAVILAAAAAGTKNIRLTSAVSVLSTADPVRAFQNFATLDLISQGRAEMVVGRGSSIESFPLFGFDLQEYDQIFAEKLDLLLTIRDKEVVNWSGKYRPALHNQAIYPRPLQDPMPIWLGVGGTPASFVRAGMLGLPLMVAIIGGETHRFRPLIDLYRQAWQEAGHPPEQLKVGIHSLGYVANTTEEAIENYYPGYAETFTKLGKERGWPPVTRAHFDAQAGPLGAFLVGSPEDVAKKIIRHSEALGGVSRFTFQMDVANLSHTQLLQAIDLIGKKVVPLVNKGAVTSPVTQKASVVPVTADM